MTPQIAIIVAARTIEELSGFLAELNRKTANPDNVEIICVFDEEKAPTIINEFSVKFFKNIQPLKGYIGLDPSYSKAVSMISPGVYFTSIFSTKTHFKQSGWDENLMKYAHAFPDNIYRVRISRFRNLRYGNDLRKALCCPENFSFCTKRLMDVLVGDSDRFIPVTDSGLEGIFWMLAQLEVNDRELVANDLQLEEYQYSAKPPFTRMMIDWNFKFFSQHETATEYFKTMALLLKSAIEEHPVQKAKIQKKYRFLIGFEKEKNPEDLINRKIRRAVDITYDYLKEKYGDL